MKVAWFVALFSAICLEGLGRKYIPQVPPIAFYFLKDVVLLIGYFRFRPPAAVRSMQGFLFRGFQYVWLAGFAWTLLETFNPDHQSFPLALVGLRAYWLWWIAPAVVAGVLMQPKRKKQAVYALIVMAAGIAVLAAIQFASPADSAVNIYTVRDGEEIYAQDVAIVASTGRARVASTFSFITGFADFTVLIPALLLSIGLETKDRRLRRYTLMATFATAAVVPMAGSRGSVIVAAGILGVAAWASGLFFTRIGRRVLVGGSTAVLLSLFAFPDAMSGVQSRFENTEETEGRLAEMATFVPPVALVSLDYPTAGLGTGMQQNARTSLRVYTKWEAEGEVGRLLIELGPIGYLLIWLTKFGLTAALFRAYKILKMAGRRGAAGAALSYAALSMIGSLVFDHIFQALYFTGCGFILAEVASLARAPGQQLAIAPPTVAPLGATAAVWATQSSAPSRSSTMDGQERRES
jgi:hypothetical protein